MKVRFRVSGEEQRLGIPYPKGDSPESTNVGYFDVKRNPDALSNFPELEGWKELKDFIQAANQPDSLFRTLRCDVAANGINHSGFKQKISSYITVAFEILDWNLGQEPYQELYKAFCEIARDYPVPDSTFVEFELIPTSYLEHLINRGWSVDLWCTGLGKTKHEARTSWRAGLQSLKKFLVGESTLYVDQLRKGRKTIS
jgi:hypothetical protein